MDSAVRLVCPRTKAPLIRVGERLVSTDAETRYYYLIEDGIPIMIPREEQRLPVEEWKKLIGEGPATEQQKA